MDWREWRNSGSTAQKVSELYDEMIKKLNPSFIDEEVLQFIEKKFRVS